MTGPAAPAAQPWAEARARVADFLEDVSRDARVVVHCHNDADGLAAGAIFGRGLPRLGYTDVRVVPSLRGESPFTEPARARLGALDPDALIVTDLGVHADGVLPGVPTLYVDHHRPAGTPAAAVIVSGYHWDPIPTAAWLALELLRPLADIEDLTWLAALGVIGDLGDRAPWPELVSVRRRYTAKWLREGVSLVNAARRSSAADADTPLRMLLEIDHPRELSVNADLGAERLHAYRAEVSEAVRRARRHPPAFSRTEPFALVRLSSPCQIHPLIAQQWRNRLSEYAVIAANTGYLPGVVAFSIRTARRDLRLPAILQAIELGDVDGRYGQGHDQASGGHLAPEAFGRLLRALGFEESTATTGTPAPLNAQR